LVVLGLWLCRLLGLPPPLFNRPSNLILIRPHRKHPVSLQAVPGLIVLDEF
jgi:hypothetical protein